MVVFFLTAIILPVKTSVKTVVKNEDDFEKNVEDIVTMVVTVVVSMETYFKTEAGKEKLKELQDKIEEGENVRPKVMNCLKSGKFDEASDMSSQVQQTSQQRQQNCYTEYRNILTELSVRSLWMKNKKNYKKY